MFSVQLKIFRTEQAFQEAYRKMFTFLSRSSPLRNRSNPCEKGKRGRRVTERVGVERGSVQSGNPIWLSLKKCNLKSSGKETAQWPADCLHSDLSTVGLKHATTSDQHLIVKNVTKLGLFLVQSLINRKLQIALIYKTSWDNDSFNEKRSALYKMYHCWE